MKENEYLTASEAAERFGVKRQAVQRRINRDYKIGLNLHGSKKFGRDWQITEDYMHSREWRRRK